MKRKFGFTAVINSNRSSLNIEYTNKFSSDGIIVFKHMNGKFEDDKIFFEDSKYIIVLDGVVLNREKIQLPQKSWPETVASLYETKGEVFFDEFRGSFGGLLYDKLKRKTILFSDHVGSKFLYYTELENGEILVSTMISHLYLIRQNNNFSCNLSVESAYVLLTYGFMLGGRTLCNEVSKMNPGYYAIIEDGKLKENRYCLLCNLQDYAITEDDAIELFDKEFRRAIDLEFSHERNAGFSKHLVSLSAGLDSRMVSWVAHDMGYIDQQNITFSQTNYWDELIPKKISTYLGHEWIFKALDNGLWLFDIDEVLDITGGNVLYYGQAHVNYMMRSLDCSPFALIHTGNKGDVSFVANTHNKDINKKYELGHGAYSSKYLDVIKNICLEEYPNDEIANFYHRGFSGVNNGSLMEMPWVEHVSPFMDWDLMNSVLQVPLALRLDYNIYKKWIIRKYPEAAKFEWERISAKITAPTIKVMGRDRTINQWLKTITSRIGFNTRGTSSLNNMNPIGYYYKHNMRLKGIIDSELDNYTLIGDVKLRNVVKDIIDNGTDMEKIQAVTLVSAIRKFKLV